MTAVVTYANQLPVTETAQERQYKEGPHELREAFAAGERAAMRQYQEEVPPRLRAMVNRVRALAVRPEAARRSTADILQQVASEFADRTLDSW